MGAEFQIMGLDRFAFRQWLALQLTPMAGQAGSGDAAVAAVAAHRSGIKLCSSIVHE